MRVGEWALTGTVLLPGDPVRDGLVGRWVRSQRKPVSYYDTCASRVGDRVRVVNTRGRVARVYCCTSMSKMWIWIALGRVTVATVLVGSIGIEL